MCTACGVTPWPIRSGIMFCTFVVCERRSDGRDGRLCGGVQCSAAPGQVEDFDSCWPADFLADDLPEARVLSVGYKTRFLETGGYTLGIKVGDIKIRRFGRLSPSCTLQHTLKMPL
eukprot:1480994-Pyramimonas_sp.AAC.1